MAVDVAFDGEDALGHLAGTDYDVVVLDRDLPRVHGDDVCRHARRRATAEPGAHADRRGLGRRPGRGSRASAPTTTCRNLSPSPSWSPGSRRSGGDPRRAIPPDPRPWRPHPRPGATSRHPGGQGPRLSPKEFAVLERLLAAQGRVLTVGELLEGVWDEMADPFTQTVKMTVSRLRAKLGDPPLIETVPDGGYRI